MDVWKAWLRRATGYDAPEIEVVQHTLRVKDHGPATVQPASAGVAEGMRTALPPCRRRLLSPGDRAKGAGGSPGGRSVPHARVAPTAVQAPDAAATAHAPGAPASAPAPVDAVAQRVLQIVAEQTGYPPDMLALDLDLEADLGIDTVKQAEMFAAIRAAYGIERDDNLALRDYPTLGRAIEFVYEKRPDLKSAAQVAVPVAAPVAAAMVPDATAPAGGVPANAAGRTAGTTGVALPHAVGLR